MKRKRAARIALAATAEAIAPATRCSSTKESSDGLFPLFVRRVRSLLQIDENGGSAIASMVGQPSPPPPPPGPAPQVSEVPPPPPQFVSGSQQRAAPMGSPALGPGKDPSVPCLTNKEVVAVQDYTAEGVGYLSLRRGDRLRLKHPRCEPAGERDQFGSYIYGARIGGPSEDDPALTNTVMGWFPFDLVQF